VSRRRRRNPPLFKGLLGEGIRIVTGGAGVTVGEIVNRQGVQMLRLDPQSPVGIGVQFGIALAAGIGAKRFLKLSGPFVDGLVYGAASAPFKAGLRLIAPGVAARLLDGGEVALAPGVSGWPIDGAGMGAYATLPPANREAAALMAAYSTGIYG
jgi:hypothetical protein